MHLEGMDGQYAFDEDDLSLVFRTGPESPVVWLNFAGTSAVIIFSDPRFAAEAQARLDGVLVPESARAVLRVGSSCPLCP